MCAAIAGKTGTVNGVCNSVKSWEINVTTDMLDVTDFCSGGWKEFIEGLSGATGSLVATEAFTLVGPATLTLANSAGGVSITGDAFLNEKGYSNAVDGAIEYNYSFTYTGAVTVT